MKLLASLLVFLSLNISIAQTTEYETGQNSSDAWTGWSTPVVTNVTNSSINGINIYNFVLDNSANTYSLEISKQITINSSDLDFYLNTTSESSTISLSISTDNSTWTEIGTSTTTGFGLNQMVVPTINPQNLNFYVKIKLSGSIGSQSAAMINSLVIKADMNSPLVSVKELKDDTDLKFYNNTIFINSDQSNYSVSLFDLSGKLLMQKSNITNYSLFDFPKGIYFVTYQNSNGYRKTIKIVR
jgi:hypothetical protein